MVANTRPTSAAETGLNVQFMLALYQETHAIDEDTEDREKVHPVRCEMKVEDTLHFAHRDFGRGIHEDGYNDTSIVTHVAHASRFRFTKDPPPRISGYCVRLDSD